MCTSLCVISFAIDSTDAADDAYVSGGLVSELVGL